MDDDALRDEKDRLGLAATVLRSAKHRTQQKAAARLGTSPKRVWKVESGEMAGREGLEEFAKRLGLRTIHSLKTFDLVEFLAEDRLNPFDPLEPNPRQEVAIYEAGRGAAAWFERVMYDDCRRKNLQKARSTAAEAWERLQGIEPSRRPAAIRNGPASEAWALCKHLCAETVRQVVRDPALAIHVGRLAVVAARCIAMPWSGRFVAYALAHAANAFRVQGRHGKAARLLAQAHRSWDASPADPGLLDPGRILDLEASLLKDQRRLPEALAVLRRALPISRVPGRILFKEALVLSLMGHYAGAIAILRRAEETFVNREPRDEAVLKYGLGVNLCHLNCFDEAAEYAEAAYTLNEASGNPIDILRSFWLQARVLAGRGDHLVALGIYRILRREFSKLRMTYDVALVTLELAASLLSLGRIRECRLLVAGLPSYFEVKGIYEEAMEAIRLFAESVQLETATEALAREVIAFLYLARGNQGLRFVPANS